ncbi:tetraspanin-33-like [Dermacentor silvarum]|uniref:tetraspanin-33-like n=1 Tax=Dermacentor silvarum TaxID=543639 RepID=UPI002101BD32|nr:tetraspanin-33-like [Dermacentor silvarum]
MNLYQNILGTFVLSWAGGMCHTVPKKKKKSCFSQCEDQLVVRGIRQPAFAPAMEEEATKARIFLKDVDGTEEQKFVPTSEKLEPVCYVSVATQTKDLGDPSPVIRPVALAADVTGTEAAALNLDVNPFVRYPLIIMNCVLWVLGLVLFVGGLYAYISTSSRASAPEPSETVLNIYSQLVVHVEATVMLVGTLLVLLSFCGCVGALRENTCLLNAYSSLITALLLLNLIVGLLVFSLPAQLKRMLRSTLSTHLVMHYRDSPDLQHLIDSIQEDLQCCGLSQRSFRDWNSNMYFNCSRTNPSSERCSVPYSCCRRNSTQEVVNLSCGQGVLNRTDYDAWFTVYTGNCVDAAHRFMRENVTIITGTCLVFVILLAFVQMVTQALVDEIFIIRRIYEKVYDRLYDMRASADNTD